MNPLTTLATRGSSSLPCPRDQRRERSSPVILSSTTLLPIQADSGGSSYYDSTHENNLAPLRLESSKREGIYGWGPLSGPAGCKLFIFLRHTSQLAVKLLSVVHGPIAETRFWIDFDGKKVPAAPHKFYFNENEYPSEDVNIEGLGRDREILLALVPSSVRRQVPIRLYVVGDRGMVEHNVQLGYFQYDENSFNMNGTELIVVPLKTYDEVKRKGQALLNFLASERPALEDARVPKQYLASEMTGVLNNAGPPDN